MRKFIFCLAFILLASGLSAQQQLSFSYDDAGNRFSRAIIGSAHLQNISGNVDAVGFYRGRTTVRLNEFPREGYSGVSFGDYLFGGDIYDG